MKWTVPAFIVPFGLAIFLPVSGYEPRAGVLLCVAGLVEILASRAWAQSEHHRFMPGEPVLSMEQATRQLRSVYILMGVALVALGLLSWRYGGLLSLATR